jgi:hypothetical protein
MGGREKGGEEIGRSIREAVHKDSKDKPKLHLCKEE